MIFTFRAGKQAARHKLIPSNDMNMSCLEKWLATVYHSNNSCKDDSSFEQISLASLHRGWNRQAGSGAIAPGILMTGYVSLRCNFGLGRYKNRRHAGACFIDCSTSHHLILKFLPEGDLNRFVKGDRKSCTADRLGDAVLPQVSPALQVWIEMSSA